MSKKIKYTIGLLLLFTFLIGCSTDNDSEVDHSPEEENVPDDEMLELSEELDHLEERVQELEDTVREQNIELENQSTLMGLLPQSWETAEEFLEAYLNLDYEVLDELISDDYTIEEEGIVLTEQSTHTPYLAQQHDELDYLLNNFGLVEDTGTNQMRMNIHFHVINDDEIADLVIMNLVLEKISEEWQVIEIELS